ncbi:hypothetical protein NDU88_000623 [Pleurodeles waltl]|uniref:Uncharacterized protein n=1 Tax=Pleurodeles waltl TaxID=8319 RepID=A0AAV7TGE4_PLEWA|nr:hypothetical protein NDU88_000623 [Pleurodeles waltl]
MVFPQCGGKREHQVELGERTLRALSQPRWQVAPPCGSCEGVSMDWPAGGLCAAYELGFGPDTGVRGILGNLTWAKWSGNPLESEVVDRWSLSTGVCLKDTPKGDQWAKRYEEEELIKVEEEEEDQEEASENQRMVHKEYRQEVNCQ